MILIRKFTMHLPSSLIVAFLLMPLASVVAQDVTPPKAPPSERQEAKPQEGKKDPPQSLDDLLGLDKEKQDAGADETADREMKEELERELTEKKIADAFRQAVEKMQLSAELLDEKFDPGLGTQRVQEEIIEKLQQLIDQAKKDNNSSSSSKSSSQQQQQQQQSPGKKQPQPGSEQGQQSQSGGQENQGESEPPGMQTGDLNTILEETRSEWGSLPGRIRDMLMQGRQDKYSALYDRLTSEYYKKLAEENPR